MTKRRIATGVVHRVPADLQKTLISASAVQDAWNDLTPLPVMNGFAGLPLSKSRKPEYVVLSEYAPSY